jgi:hypothetical protein
MLTVKQLNPKIAGVRKSTKAMRANIQEILVHAAGNAFQSGDVTAFDKLIDATRGADQKAIMKWVREFGFAVYNTDKNCYNVNMSMRKSADFVDGEAVVEYLGTQATWYELQSTVSQNANELDVTKRLQSLLKATRETGTIVKVDFKAARELMDALHHELAEQDRKNQEAIAY